MLNRTLLLIIACLTGCSYADPPPQVPVVTVAPPAPDTTNSVSPTPRSEEWRSVVGTRQDLRNYDPSCTFTIANEPRVFPLWFLARMDAESRGLPHSVITRHCPNKTVSVP